MTPRERFRATMEYRTPDRLPLSPLHGQPEAWTRLYEYFGIPDALSVEESPIPGPRYLGFNKKAHTALQDRIGEDFRRIAPKYAGPPLLIHDDGSWDGLWAERYAYMEHSRGRYAETVFLPYKEIDTVHDAEKIRKPSPDWYDYSTIDQQCKEKPAHILIAGSPGVLDFINGTAFSRGVEQVLIDISTEDPVFLYLIEQRFQFYYGWMERILLAARGRIDVVYVGDDLGMQSGPIINPRSFTKLMAPYYERFFALAHSHGARTMMHSCGAVRAFIPILIDLGLDILDAVQVDAAGMDIESLHSEFYRKIAFCGTMSVQRLLPQGTTFEVAEAVRLRKRLFGEGGIMIGPANLMQADMPPENFASMCRTLGSLTT